MKVIKGYQLLVRFITYNPLSLIHAITNPKSDYSQ